MSEPSGQRHEFRFVIDGLDLDEEQKAQVALAVQTAGIKALTSAKIRLDNPLMVGHANIKLRKEWLGLWVLNGLRAEELGSRLDGTFGP